MGNIPLVSVIVPCYNHAKYLPEALSSVLKQTYTNWECIIVNDGSLDNTKQVANNWLGKDDRFRYLEKQNGGLSSARNYGINKCAGELILPLDADDILHEEFLTKSVLELKNNSDVQIISCNSLFFENKIENIIHKLTPKGNSIADLMYENILMATALYEKQLWIEVGGYDEQMKKGFEDWEFWVNVTKRGYNYKFIEEFLFYYRKSKKSMLVDTLNNHVEANIDYVFKKHKELYIEHFDTTLDYLLFLVKRYKSSEQKIKKSLEYKLARVLVKPLKLLKIIR